MHWGTLGPQALGIDRALWIGTPYSSRWMRQVTGVPRPDVDPDPRRRVQRPRPVRRAWPADDRARLRYVLVSHDNDGVTKFGADLITSRPRWLSPGRPPVQEVPEPARGHPARMRWRPLTTFLQTLIDMKNAQVPGGYRAWAHDYRPDLARFIRDVYGLPASDEELMRVEQALEKREAARERLFSAPPAGHDSRHRVDRPAVGRGGTRRILGPPRRVGSACCSRAPPCSFPRRRSRRGRTLCGRPRSSSTTSARSRSRSRRRRPPPRTPRARRPGRAGSSTCRPSPARRRPRSASAFANADNRFATSALVNDSLRLSSRSDMTGSRSAPRARPASRQA